MARKDSAHFLLLVLPDPCLLAVLQCCAADEQRSVFSAARVHSRLHQAAVAALHSINAVVPDQQQLIEVLWYIRKHSRHVGSIQIASEPSWGAACFHWPSDLRLRSLQLEDLVLQLQPHQGFKGQGVLGAAAVVAALKQLRIRQCQLIDDTQAIEAALTQLPSALEHLSISDLYGLAGRDHPLPVPAIMLQHLQQLTYLELACSITQGPDKASPVLQPLTALTRLVDLRLHGVQAADHTAPGDGSGVISAAMLSGARHLTCLQLSGEVEVEPGVLAGKTKLQHLQLAECELLGRDSEAQLLSHLQHLQQLTELCLRHTLREGDSSPPACSALTASSKLERLSLSWCKLPDGAWQHVFPAGRQLPHLRVLSLDVPEVHCEGPAAAPEGSRLVSCCPGLQDLNIEGLQCTPELLAALQGLSGLEALHVNEFFATDEGMGALCQLTQLQQLDLHVAYVDPDKKQRLLLGLTQLKQLAVLNYSPFAGFLEPLLTLDQTADGGTPVWRQILQLYQDDSDHEDA